MTVRARVCRRHSKQAPLAVLFVADDGRDEHSETGCSRRFDWCKPHPGRVIGCPNPGAQQRGTRIYHVLGGHDQGN